MGHPPVSRFRERYANDPVYREAQKAYSKARYYKSAAYVKAKAANHQARRYGIRGRLTEADVLDLWKAQPVCVSCGTGQGIDHIFPMARGGANERDNIQNLCLPCNRTKWAHLPPEKVEP